MKKVIFLHTHLGSNYESLLSVLESFPRIQVYKNMGPFQHPDELFKLFACKHKLDNSAAMYLHPILENHEWVSLSIRNSAKNIFYFRDPISTLQEIKNLNYYSLRLRGLYEMAKNTKDKIVVTSDDLSKINAYLDIDMKISISKLEGLGDSEIVSQYNNYINFLMQ